MKKNTKKLTIHQQELENEVQKQMKEIYSNNDKKVTSTANIRKLLPFYAKYKGLFVTFIVLMIVYIGVSFIGPIIAAQIMEYLTLKDFNYVLRYSIYYLVNGLAVGIILFIIAEIRAKLYYKMNFDLRQNLIGAIDRLSMRKLDEINSGVLISRLEGDSSRCANAIVQIVDHLLNLIKAFAFFIYIAFVNIWLFLILAAYVVIKNLLDSYRFGIWRKNRKVITRRYDSAYNVYFEQIRGIRDVKTLNLRDNMAQVSAEKVQYVYDLDLKLDQKTNRLYYFISYPLDYLIEFILIVVGILLITQNIIAFAGFMVVYLYKGRALSLSTYFTHLKDKLSEGELSAERYFDVVDRFEKDEFGVINKSIKTGKIEFKNVEFQYDDNSQVLKGVNLTIEPNKTTAIIGKSGSGKSTMLSLVGKMYSPTDGEILIDGLNLNDMTENSLRNAIGIVNQSPYIFNASIRNNMLYVKPKATEKEIWQALDKAQIGDFVRGLENGLDSMIGENGVKVSGGQKQRLAIARVLLKGNKVLVFDEATSALDNASQAAIVAELDKLKNDHTIIVVAHRLSTIVDADNIIVLDDGKIVAQGKHSELMQSCRVYKDLYLEEENDKKLKK